MCSKPSHKQNEKKLTSKTLKIDRVPPSVVFNISLEFTYLTETNLQYLIDWVEEFNQLAGFNENQSTNLLRIFRNREVYEKIKSKKGMNNKLKELMNNSVDPYMMQAYLSDVQGTKQKLYRFTNDYNKDIKTNTRILSISRSEKTEIVKATYEN